MPCAASIELRDFKRLKSESRMVHIFRTKPERQATHSHQVSRQASPKMRSFVIGSRVVLLPMMPSVPIGITDNTNGVCAFLMASGRWVERVIPTGSGDYHLTDACL